VFWTPKIRLLLLSNWQPRLQRNDDYRWGWKFWYLSHVSTANILSLFKLGQKYHITYNGGICGGIFIVTTPHGVIKFHPLDNGLHFLGLNGNPEAAILHVNDAFITCSMMPPLQITTSMLTLSIRISKVSLKNKVSTPSVLAASWGCLPTWLSSNGMSKYA